MQPLILAALLEVPRVALAMSAAGLVLLAIGVMAAKDDVAQARGLDKIVALNTVCFALPLAVFGALHYSSPDSLIGMVPKYMPWRIFWVYFVGTALIAAALSIATRVQVRWSGLLVGTMMFLFVLMLYLPSALKTGARLTWTIAFRESSFGSGGLILAGIAMGGLRGKGKGVITVGRVVIGLAALVFGVQHFIRPLGMPSIPLQKEMPTWIPARAAIGYLTGAMLVAAGAAFVSGRKVRMAATYLGAWIVLLIVLIYTPVMIGALADPSAAVKVEGIDYFADTLLFAGAILSLARAMQGSGQDGRLAG